MPKYHQLDGSEEQKFILSQFWKECQSQGQLGHSFSDTWKGELLPLLASGEGDLSLNLLG